jgi:hypothetical protein
MQLITNRSSWGVSVALVLIFPKPDQRAGLRSAQNSCAVTDTCVYSNDLLDTADIKYLAEL